MLVAVASSLLKKESIYSQVPDKIMVKFGNANTSCFVDEGRKNGVVKTGTDSNLGEIGPRPVENLHSYQLYGPSGQVLSGLAVSANFTARIEAISIPELSGPEKVQG